MAMDFADFTFGSYGAFALLGAAPVSATQYLTLVRIEFLPMSLDATTLADELNAVTTAAGLAEGLGRGNGFGFPGTEAPVPEPATLLLLGAGLVGLRCSIDDYHAITCDLRAKT